MLVDHKNEAPAKCDIKLCRCLIQHKFKCTKCGMVYHWACYRGLILEVKDKPQLPAIPKGFICCTKKCYHIIVKDASSNNSQRGDWKTNGKPEISNITSLKLFLDWWLEHSEYEIICGKGNDGVKKIIVCKEFAQEMMSPDYFGKPHRQECKV